MKLLQPNLLSAYADISDGVWDLCQPYNCKIIPDIYSNKFLRHIVLILFQNLNNSGQIKDGDSKLPNFSSIPFHNRLRYTFIRA